YRSFLGSSFGDRSRFAGLGLSRSLLGDDFFRRKIGGVGRSLLGDGLLDRKIGGVGRSRGCLGRCGFLRRALLDALLGLLAWLGLLRVQASGTLADARGVEEAQHAVRRLRADT